MFRASVFQSNLHSPNSIIISPQIKENNDNQKKMFNILYIQKCIHKYTITHDITINDLLA